MDTEEDISAIEAWQGSCNLGVLFLYGIVEDDCLRGAQADEKHPVEEKMQQQQPCLVGQPFLPILLKLLHVLRD
jgi:hypothetical protein